MKLNPGSIVILFATALFAFCSCDEGGGKKMRRAFRAGRPVYILVGDPGNRRGAIVGGTLSTLYGIAIGKAFIRDSGWLTVDAMGYVPADIRPLQFYNGYALGETRLTRVQQMVLLESGDTGILECVDDGGAALVSAEVNASDFKVKPVAVNAAWIYPDNLERDKFLNENNRSYRRWRRRMTNHWRPVASGQELVKYQGWLWENRLSRSGGLRRGAAVETFTDACSTILRT